MQVKIQLSPAAAEVVSLEKLEELVKPIFPRLHEAKFISYETIAKRARTDPTIRKGEISVIPIIVEEHSLVGLCLIEGHERCLFFMLPEEYGVSDEAVRFILSRIGPVKDGQHRSFSSLM